MDTLMWMAALSSAWKRVCIQPGLCPQSFSLAPEKNLNLCCSMWLLLEPNFVPGI